MVSRVEEYLDLLLKLPFLVSQAALGAQIKGKTVLDIASGPDTELGEWVTGEGGRYIAFDVIKECLDQHKLKKLPAVQGTVKQFPFKSNAVDITWMSYFLALAPPKKRGVIIRTTVDIAREKSWFLEEDILFKGPLAHRARDLSSQMRAKVLGRNNKEHRLKLIDEITTAIPEHKARIFGERLLHGDKKTTTATFINGLRESAKIYAPELLPKIKKLLTEMKSEAKKDPNSYIRTCISIVVVFKGGN